MSDPKILPSDPTVGDLIGDGDTVPPDMPPDPLDPDAPTNTPPEPDSISIVDPDDDTSDQAARTSIDVGPVTLGVESDLQTNVVGTVGVKF